MCSSDLHDGSHAHGDGAGRHFVPSAEVAGGVFDGEVVEVDHARFRGEGGAGFVESDVSRAPDAQNLDVDAARLFDGAFVCRTEGFHFVRLQGAVGDVDVLRKDVHLAEEVMVHEMVVALFRLPFHGHVFVEVEGDDVAEGEPLFPVHPDQFGVELDGGGACCQSQHAGPALGGARAYQFRYFPGNGFHGLRRGFEYLYGHFLESVGAFSPCDVIAVQHSLWICGAKVGIFSEIFISL